MLCVKMKQMEFCSCHTSSSCDGCNGHANHFKSISRDSVRCTNGSRFPNCETQIDKTKENRAHIRLQQIYKRSHRCLEQNYVVQNSFNIATIYSKFAFQRIMNFLVIVALFACCSTVNGHHTKSRYTRNSDVFSAHKTHTIIRPTIFDVTNQRQILSSTRQTNDEHASHIILEYTHLDKAIVADLFLTQHLLTDRHFLRSQNADGSNSIRTFNRTNSDLCHYQGRIRNNPNSLVVLSTCNGIDGIVYDGDDTYFIHPNELAAFNEPHYLFSQSQILESNSVFADPDIVAEIPKRIIKRSVAETTLREPYNANRQSSFVELVMVVDNEVYKKMDENLDKVHKYCKDIANIINSLYVPVNIFVALVGVVVWTEKNEIELSQDGDKTLKNFLTYRRKILIKDHPNDNAQLLTSIQFEGGVVGKALKGPICTFEFSGGVSTYHSEITSVVATTIAHEMGHNFGMEHDTPDCECADDRCIMSASSSSIAPTQWSECSIHQLNMAIHQGMNHCLKNVPKYLFEPPTCGNGFVEKGEECDCGLPSVCKNTCCDPFTCKLHSNATCASGKCCDLGTCQPHEAGFQCRSAAGQCDLPEYCDGESEFCPVDYFKQDGEECGSGKAYCYNGSCKSRDDQCKVLWGPSGISSELCYEKNLDGSRHGNCGYNRSNNVYKNCTRSDILCGMLQCRHLNERLEFGLESVAVLSHSFITHGGSVVPCRTALIDLGLDSVDPGLAPDGSKCGDGKMCMSQKCVSIDALRTQKTMKSCEHDCNKHGVCDNMGHCHCDNGFAPPLCDSPGPGGSLHSGPASNPYSGYGFVRIMYIFFLGVVPFISLSLFLFYYWQQNRPWFISQSGASESKVSVRHGPNRPPPPPPSGAPTNNQQLSPSSTDDMNATLLKSNEANGTSIKRELFGNFKGFSLKPLPMTKPSIVGASNVAYVHPVAKTETENEQCMPIRAAPLPPANSPKKAQSKSSPAPQPKASPSSFRYQNVNASPKKTPETPIEVKLFASKSDAKERPKISHPVLENSTCSVKDLVATANATADQNLKNIQNSYSTLPRNKRVVINATPVETQNLPAIEKNPPKKLDISAPVRASFGRSQSMRSPSSEKAQVKRNGLASGSMRHPGGVKRANTIDRPKNPPPPRPTNLPESNASSTRNIYANEANSVNNSTDNIYCVIEDVKETSPPNGLLSEIVNEIENRNLNSIYSTTKRKNPPNESSQTTNLSQSDEKQAEEQQLNPQNNSIYMNTATVEQPLIKKQPANELKDEPEKTNVASIAKKLSKPVIANKPSISVGLIKETSQSDSAKKPYIAKNASKVQSTGKATIHPTSSIRAMHRRFENKNQ